MTTEPLNPLTLPLHGSRLIEASAGTGKTWTIAALVLRLVLGHGGGRPLMPAEILVMTFTRAATRELAKRIRQRLVEAAACFRGDRAPEAGDAFLLALLQDFADAEARSAAAWRLSLAAEAMDDAAVTTIDAWCQRMLREHAFDSGCLFDEELQADETAMRDQAVRDYWRQQVYPLDEPGLAVALGSWPDIGALTRDVRGLIDDAPALAIDSRPGTGGDDSLGTCIAQALGERQAELSSLKHGWVADAAAMKDWLNRQMALRDCPFDKRKLKPSNYEGWIAKIGHWAADRELQALDLTEAARRRLTPSGIGEALKPGTALELPGLFARFETLQAALERLQPLGVRLRLHAARHIAARLQMLKDQAGAFGFRDMLQRLDDALDVQQQGERAERLRQRILEQFPAALIDEFQDTSPLQLSIFDRLYRLADNDPQTALLLIGDPKQSIYGFRGADIASYLGARRATAGRHHRLGTNHRSTAALVAAVNHVFERAEIRDDDGAFLLGKAGPIAAVGDAADPASDRTDDGLPFEPVSARGRPERLVDASGNVKALSFCVDTSLASNGDHRERFADLAAERIVGWLNDASCGFVTAEGTMRRLLPADIAVLVRTGVEATAIRRALRRRGVASVYLSDKDSVFASDEAEDLLRLLQAIASPRDTRLARAALATSLIGLSLDELRTLADDDEDFDRRCELLAALQLNWQSQGVLAMLRRALHGFGLAARWLGESVVSRGSSDPGERRMTNLLHLAELLQAASAQIEGEQGLIRWLGEQIVAAHEGRGGMAGDEQVLRLESDADLVKVITIHKSKGLEFAVVLMPFATHFRRADGRSSLIWQQDEQGRRRPLLAPTAEDLQREDRRRLQEDMRLLYVALTRARHALWVGVAALKQGNSSTCVWSHSAIGRLLSGDVQRTADEIRDDVHQAAADCDAMAVIDATPQSGGEDPPAHGVPRTPLHRRESPPPLRDAPHYAARFERDWVVTSYSALVRDTARSNPTPPIADSPLRLLRDDEPREALPVDAAARPPDADAPWHRFPRGALAGNLLHGLLEWLADEGFALDGSTALQQALVRRCERQGWSHRADDALRWLRRVCSTTMPPVGVPLSCLQVRLPEMEFWFPSDGLRTARIDALCRQHLLPGLPRPPLGERALRGMLMGFADLVFEHGGRFWVLDYKSNALGADDAGYDTAALAHAMAEHRYDVQAALYLLALHRLLRSRMGEAYRPAQHLGGAVYLFLRGVAGPSAGCFHLPAPLPLIDELDAGMATPSNDPDSLDVDDGDVDAISEADRPA